MGKKYQKPTVSDEELDSLFGDSDIPADHISQSSGPNSSWCYINLPSGGQTKRFSDQDSHRLPNSDLAMETAAETLSHLRTAKRGCFKSPPSISSQDSTPNHNFSGDFDRKSSPADSYSKTSDSSPDVIEPRLPFQDGYSDESRLERFKQAILEDPKNFALLYQRVVSSKS